jgi:peroxiredoxin
MAKLSVGEKFPEFKFKTAAGAELSSLEVIGRAKKTVFWVLRYVGCTSCRYDIHLIKTRYKEFTDIDAQILVVLQSPPETINNDLKGDETPYDIISDPDQAIYKRFSIEPAPSKEALGPQGPDEIAKWQAKREAIKTSGFVHGKYEGIEEQLPALFIIAPDRKVLYSRYAKNIADLPSVDELLALLKTI